MSEPDYQRGLRGGSCPSGVSASYEWDRYKDWKDGHDEYERRMEAEDEERFAEVSTPAERIARINERERERDDKEARRIEFAKHNARANIARRQSDRRTDHVLAFVTSIVAIGFGCLVGLIAGLVLTIIGLPFAVGFGVTAIIVSYFAVNDNLKNFAKAEEERNGEDQRDRSLL